MDTDIQEKELDKATKDHNDWARHNIEPRDRMVCKNCGAIVDHHWMIPGYGEIVEKLCGPCFFKKEREKRKERRESWKKR